MATGLPTARRNPFPLSGKQRLAVLAWVLYLCALMPESDTYLFGLICITAVFEILSKPHMDPSWVSLAYEALLIFAIPALPVWAVAFLAWKERRCSRVMGWVFGTAVVLPWPLALYVWGSGEPIFGPGFFLWWGAIILAAVALTWDSKPKERRPFQFRLSTLLLLSVVVPLLVVANLRLSPGSESAGLVVAVRALASLLLLVLVFDTWEAWRCKADARRALPPAEMR